MKELQKKHIDIALPKVKNGLEKYLWLQGELRKRNVYTDREFQRKFNSFYRIRRNQEWQKEFYKLLEQNKNAPTDFLTVLSRLHKKTSRIEASFASKLIATIDPEMPVIDKIVFANLDLRLPPATKTNREQVINVLYHTLHKNLLKLLETENGKYLVYQFVKEYPQAKITKIKMLDLVLWQMRT